MCKKIQMVGLKGILKMSKMKQDPPRCLKVGTRAHLHPLSRVNQSDQLFFMDDFPWPTRIMNC